MENCILDYASGTVAAELERSRRVLVQDVAFTLHASERLALVGETGSGKTMTALSVLRLLPDNVTMQGGRLEFAGRDLLRCRDMTRIRGSEIVYIPQSGMESLNPARSVRRHLYDSLKKNGVRRSDLERTALEKLRLAGFDAPQSVLDKYPFQLSGGMAQRVVIAVSACSDAKLILADEPTNGLDAEGTRQFFTLLDTVFPRAAKLIITHDVGVAALCDRVLVLLGGRMMESGPAAQVLQQSRHPYTAALLGARPENGLVQTPRLRPAAGSCPFYARCPRGDTTCLGEIPLRRENTTEWRCCR